MGKLDELRAALDVIEAIHKGLRTATIYGRYHVRRILGQVSVIIDETTGLELYDEEANHPRTFESIDAAVDFLHGMRRAEIGAAENSAVVVN